MVNIEILLKKSYAFKLTQIQHPWPSYNLYFEAYIKCIITPFSSVHLSHPPDGLLGLLDVR